MSLPQDLTNNKGYRRGLVLGMTMAEIMILLIFLLLMALAASLAAREKQIDFYKNGEYSELVAAIQREFPEASKSEDFVKEMVQAIETQKAVEKTSLGAQRDKYREYAELGAKAAKEAAAAGITDVPAFIRGAIAKSQDGKIGEWPPFLSLSEAGGYFFDSGKATLRPEFEANLRSTVIPLLEQYTKDYNVDVIEVIGHTDEVPMVGRSNLDSSLISASSGSLPIASLQSTDNAGLAIARAVAVVRVLRADPKLSHITVLPLSGAQLIVPVDQVADGSSRGDDQSRRRIEIRLRKSTQQVSTSMNQNARSN